MTAALAIAVCGVMGFVLWKNSNPTEPPTKERLPERMGSVVPYKAPEMVMPVAAKPIAPTADQTPRLPDQQPPLRPPPAAPLQMPASITMPSLANITPPPPIKPNMLTYALPARPPPVVDPARQGTSGQGSPGGIVYASSSLDGIKAGLIGDDTFILMPGILSCIMDTAINSTFPGPVQCHIPADIKPHGVTLLGRGAIVHGWYKNDIQTGQARLFVSADYVSDPSTGCFVKFDNAPMSDTIGQTGIPGSVNNKYLERFGAAVLLTMGETGESLGQAALSKGGNTYLNFGSGSGGVDTIASAILRKQIDIPPEITVHQGAAIAVFVVKPLDFSPCYDVKLKDRR